MYGTSLSTSTTPAPTTALLLLSSTASSSLGTSTTAIDIDIDGTGFASASYPVNHKDPFDTASSLSPRSSTMLDISTDAGSGPSGSRRSSVLLIQRFRRSPSSYSTTSSTTSSSSSSIPMDPNSSGSSRSRSKEGMSDAALVDREWEETDWERVKTLPTVYLTPPEEENSGPVALYPLLPPLPPPPAPASSNPTAPGPSNQWGGMAKGFVQPPPVFARSRGGRAGVIMPKTRDELAAEARSRRIRLAEVEDKRLSYPSPPPLTSPSASVPPEDDGALLSTKTGERGMGEDRMPPNHPSQVVQSDEQSLLVTVEPDPALKPAPTALIIHEADVESAPMTTSSSTSSASSSSSCRTSPPTRQLPLPPPESPEPGGVLTVTAPAAPQPDAASVPHDPPPSTSPPVTETPTATKPRSRKRTFSLTSLLASRSQKSSSTSSSHENIPPVPALPPVIRKHKSLKQLFTPAPAASSWTTPVPVWSPTPARRTTEPGVSGFAHAHPPPSRIGKRFSLSNLSSSFKRPIPGQGQGQGQGQEVVPPVPLLPAMYRQDEVIARRRQEYEPEVRPGGLPTNAMTVSEAHTVESPPSTSEPDERSRQVEPQEPERQPTPPLAEPPRSSSSLDDQRERSESGCSVSTLSSSASQTCRNLTHVSPRTQRNPSASLALRQYIHEGPSVGTVTEVTSTPLHRRYESLEATVVLMERTDSTSGSGSSSEGHQTVIVTPSLPIGEVPPEMTIDMDEIRRHVPITRPPTKVVLDLEPECEDEEEEMEEVYQDARESLDSAPGPSRSAKRQSTNTTINTATMRTTGLRRFITLKRHSTGSTTAALRAPPAPVEPASAWTPAHGSHLKSLHFEGERLGLDFERHDWTAEQQER